MASNPLNRLYFPILRKTSGDAGRSLQDPLGYFSCRASVARFLDIEKIAADTNALLIGTRKTYTRNSTLADGTTLGGGADGGAADTQIAESEILLSFGSKGSKSVVLVTGKPLPSNKGYHTLRIRFPGFATNLVIAEALGEIIPATKIKSPPTAADIYPYFISQGGRRYPIMAGDVAETRTEVAVPENQQEMSSLVTQTQKKKAVKGAGGAAA